MENLGNDRDLVIRVEAQDWNFYVVAVYLPSFNQSIEMYRSCLDVLEDTLNQLNAHIGDSGGPRSLPNVNDRGRLLICFMERMGFKSANSQMFCDRSKHFMHRRVRLQLLLIIYSLHLMI